MPPVPPTESMDSNFTNCPMIPRQLPVQALAGSPTQGMVARKTSGVPPPEKAQPMMLKVA